MSVNKQKKEIIPIQKKKTVSQLSKIIEYFWEEIDSDEYKEIEIKKSSTWHEDTLNLIKKAEELIIIYTPQLIDKDIILETQKAFVNGVRVYALVNTVGDYEKYLDFGIIRVKSEKIFSSYILVDPANNPAGFWFSDVISTEKVPETIIPLNKAQIKELWKLFSVEFWENDGLEYFLGSKDTVPPKITGDPPIISKTLKFVSRDLRFIDFEEAMISLVVVPEFIETYKMVADFKESVIVDSERLVVPFSDLIKDTVELYRDEDKNIYAKGSIETGIIKINDTADNEKWFVYNWDIMIKLDISQAKLIDEKKPDEPILVFRKSKKIENIKNRVILWDDIWDIKQLKKIPDEVEVSLEDIVCKNIDEWLNPENIREPAIPNKLILARNIIYKWVIKPPQLPATAKKHRLYNIWSKFKDDINTEASKLQKRIDRVIGVVNENKRLKHKKHIINELKDIYGDLDKLKDEIKDLDAKPLSVSKGIVERLNKLVDIFNKSLDKISEKDEGSELRELHKGTIDKTLKFSIKSIDVPPYKLPEVGTLYEERNRNFLCINFIDEIELAKGVARRYNAKIVVGGSSKNG